MRKGKNLKMSTLEYSQVEVGHNLDSGVSCVIPFDFFVYFDFFGEMPIT